MDLRLDQQLRFERILDRHRGRLRSLRGVTAVSVGIKQRGGEKTGELAIVVYVESKGGASGSQRVPPRLEGAPTDVVERVFDPVLTAVDPHQRQDPMFSGVAIARFSDRNTFGTLACFIRTTGKDVPSVPAGVYLLTNEHVVVPEDPSEPPTIVQPEWNLPPMPPPDTVAGTYQAGFFDARNDCAVTTIMDRGWENKVPNATGGFNALTGTLVPVVGSRVYKFGARTLLTRGTITDTNWANSPPPGSKEPLIEKAVYIQAEGADGTWIGAGDSGSAVIQDLEGESRVVVLHSRGDRATENPPNSGLFRGGIGYPIRRQMGNFADVGGTVTLA